MQGILIIGKNQTTESSIYEEFLNIQYKSKKRFIHGL